MIIFLPQYRSVLYSIDFIAFVVALVLEVSYYDFGLPRRSTYKQQCKSLLTVTVPDSSRNSEVRKILFVMVGFFGAAQILYQTHTSLKTSLTQHTDMFVLHSLRMLHCFKTN